MSFLGEIKRRKVFQVAAAYLVVAWVLVQIVATVEAPLSLPDWTDTLVIVLLAVGFPIAVILSWAFDLTAGGVERTGPVAPGEPEPPETMAATTGLAINLAAIGVLSVLLIVVGLYVFLRDEPAATPESAAIQSQSSESTDDGSEVLPNSVAVLLCDNLSPDPDDAYFAASIHSVILHQLQKMRNLTPIARTSVLQYADNPPPISQIAEELRVESVLECSVLYAGDSILVTAQLIDPETNLYLWSDTYPGDLSDLTAVFAMQADIAMNIANALEARLSPDEQERIGQIATESRLAYELYLAARLTADYEEAEDLLERAIREDPEFALAHALKAYLYASDAEGTGDFARDGRNLVDLAREAANRALDIDSSIGIAHVALGNVHFVSGELAEAQTEYERARELSPNDSDVLTLYSRFKRYVGAYDEAISLSLRATTTDPGNVFAVSQLAFSHWYARDHDAASAEFTRAIDLAATEAWPHLGLAFAEISKGNEAAALTQLQVAEELLRPNFPALRLEQLVFAYSQLGRAQEMNHFYRMLTELADRESVPQAMLGMADLAIGEHDRAFQRLGNAVTSPSIGDQIVLSELKANPYEVPTLEETPWRELRDRIGAL